MSDSGKIRISPSDLSKPLSSPAPGSVSPGSSSTVKIDRKNASSIRIDLESLLTDGPPRSRPPAQVPPLVPEAATDFAPRRPAAMTGQSVRVRKDAIRRDLPPTMKANRLLAGRKCPICNAEMQLGQDVRNCLSCKITYHLECWNENRGCGTYGCPEAPDAKERIGIPQIRLESPGSVGLQWLWEGKPNAPMNASQIGAPSNSARPLGPVQATTMCLFICWLVFLIPIPGIGILGWALNLAAFVLSIVCMAQGKVSEGIFGLLASLIVSPVVYVVGLFLMLAVFAS